MDDTQQRHHEQQTTTSKGGATTLRRPMQIVKKRSGPLEDAFAELNNEPQQQCFSTNFQNVPPSVTQNVQSVMQNVPPLTSPPSLRRKQHTIKEKKDKEKKRSERWLLTRKTWKYMTDAGRKLIPESAQNRAEDIPKIERHFHQVCANEPRFVLWRRKSSYPGATRNSKRRLKQLLSHTGQPKSQTSIELEEAQNADQIIDLLQSYLKLDEARKTTTLLGSKTVRPDQTASPSAQRPASSQQQSASGVSKLSSGGGMRGGGSARGPGFLPPPQPPRGGLHTLSEIEQLLERLRTLSRSATQCRSITLLPLERITPEMLEDKALLKQIYNELKKQQLHRILGKHSMPFQTPMRPILPHATSLTSLFHFSGGGNVSGAQPATLTTTTVAATTTSTMTTATVAGTINQQKLNQSIGVSKNKSIAFRPSPPSSGTSAISPQHRQRRPPSTLDLSSSTRQKQIPVISIKKPSVERTYSSTGTQTSFIQLNEIKRLAEEYKERKLEEAAANAASTMTDDELSDKSAAAAISSSSTMASATHRRKSSIDNEDVSQSVSDTIKRYLRMARKKSVHDDQANRFKRVNYDRNLRNIRAKGEINPPGMDEGNTKAIQTLDAWPVITLDFIRGNECSAVLAEAHAEWRKSLDERIQKKFDYEEKLRKQDAANPSSVSSNSAAVPTAKVSHSSCSSSSAPTSPTMDQQQVAAMQQHHGGGASGASGLLHSSTQFLSNLWHGVGYHHQQQNSPQHDLLATSNSNSSLGSTLTNASSSATGFSYSKIYCNYQYV